MFLNKYESQKICYCKLLLRCKRKLHIFPIDYMDMYKLKYMYIGIHKYYVKKNMFKSKMLTLLVCFEQLVTNVSCICRYLHVSVLLLPKPCGRNGQTIVHRGHGTQERWEVGRPLGQARHGAPYESRLLVDLTDSFRNVFYGVFFFTKHIPETFSFIRHVRKNVFLL